MGQNKMLLIKGIAPHIWQLVLFCVAACQLTNVRRRRTGPVFVADMKLIPYVKVPVNRWNKYGSRLLVFFSAPYIVKC